MKKIMLMVVVLVSAVLARGAQEAPIKPEETVIRSKILECRDDGKLVETRFYLMQEPQPGKMATDKDIVAYITLRAKKDNNFYLDVLHVNKEYRGRLGYGHLLLNLLKVYIRNYGAATLSGEAKPFGLRSGESDKEMFSKLVRFYESRGGKVVKVVNLPGQEFALMEIDLRSLSKRKQPWLPESPDVLSKADYAQGMEIMSIVFETTASIDEAIKKAIASPAAFVIINLEPRMPYRGKGPIKSKL